MSIPTHSSCGLTDSGRCSPRFTTWSGASIALTAILIATAALLVWLGARESLGHDCIWHIFIARQDTWNGFWGEVADNAHPPLFYAALRLMIRLFGRSLLAYRAISICATLLSLLLIARIVRQTTANPWMSVLAAAAFGLSATAVEMSLEVRAYAMCVAFLLLAYHIYIEWLSTHPKHFPLGRAVLGGSMLTAAVLTSYSALFFLAAISAVPFLLVFCHRRWRIWMWTTIRHQLLSSALMLGMPLLVALVAILHHARHWGGRMTHVSEFIYNAASETVLPFIARTTRTGMLLLSPEIDERVVLGGGILLLAAGIWLMTQAAFRCRPTFASLLIPALMIILNLVAALSGRYPYGGPTRHAYHLFPFLLVALFTVCEHIRRAMPASLARCRLWEITVGLSVFCNCLLWLSNYRMQTEAIGQHQMNTFKKSFGMPPVVLLDQFNFIRFFGHFHDWDWKIEWQLPNERRTGRFWQCWKVSRGDVMFHACRSSQWQLNLSKPETFADVAACFDVTGAACVTVFREQQEGFASGWDVANAEQFARELGTVHGLQADAVILDKQDLYLSFSRIGVEPSCGSQLP